jgi:hypothetical protein
MVWLFRLGMYELPFVYRKALAAVSASILALPVTFPIVLPAVVIANGGHLAAAGGVMTAVSQMAVEGE